MRSLLVIQLIASMVNERGKRLYQSFYAIFCGRSTDYSMALVFFVPWFPCVLAIVQSGFCRAAFFPSCLRFTVLSDNFKKSWPRT